MKRTSHYLLQSTALRNTLTVILMALLLVPNLSGCAIFAQVAGAIPKVEDANYKNLAGQSVAVVVWAEESGVRIDWPQIHIDTAQMIQSKLQKSQSVDKPKELELTRFPLAPASVARVQEDNPGESMEEIAPRLGVSRVIYVEIRGFQTRSDASQDLFRGTVTGSVNVVEVTKGKGRLAYTDDTLHIAFPKTSPEEGLPNIGDFPIYRGTLDGFATEVAKRFTPHAEDPDADYASK